MDRKWGLVPGTVAEFGGRKLVELAAVLQRRMPVIYADCANRFDPYEATRHAQDQILHPEGWSTRRRARSPSVLQGKSLGRMYPIRAGDTLLEHSSPPPKGRVSCSNLDETCLERIHIARPFTVYQLKELVYSKLEPALQHLEMPAMLFAGIDSYRPQGSADEDEFKVMMERIEARIRSLARDYGVICAISYGGGYGKDR